MDTIDKQTDCTLSAGDQSSVNIDRHMWPLLYTWGFTGMLGPINVTSGDSNGYWGLNLNCNWKCSPAYRDFSAPSISTIHLIELILFQRALLIITPRELKQKYGSSDTYCVISVYIVILLKSTLTPGGESFCIAINSFCSLFYEYIKLNKDRCACFVSHRQWYLSISPHISELIFVESLPA